MASKVLNRPYQPDYFSINHILASQTKVICLAEQIIPKFGFLVPELESQDIPPAAIFDLPLWAVERLVGPGRNRISIDFPHGLLKTPEGANEDKLVMTDLSTVPGGYYESHRLLARFGTLEGVNLALAASNAFERRLILIASFVTNSYKTKLPSWSRLEEKYPGEVPVPDFFMDAMETQLFNGFITSTKELDDFMTLFKFPLNIRPDIPAKESQPDSAISA